MPNSKDSYRDHEIVWDVVELAEGKRWRAEASVVLPADSSGINRVHPISTGEMFNSAEKARLVIIRAAREWIDNRLAQPAR